VGCHGQEGHKPGTLRTAAVLRHISHPRGSQHRLSVTWKCIPRRHGELEVNEWLRVGTVKILETREKKMIVRVSRLQNPAQ
jgi:hypothetical protein